MTRGERERYRALIEHAPVGVFEMDASLHCVYVNDRFCQMTGLSPEDALGEGWGRVIHPDDVAPIVSEFHRALVADDDFRVEHRLVRPDGATVWVLVVAHTLHDDAGPPSGLLGIVTDVTAEHLAEDRLRALVEHTSDVVVVIDDAGMLTYLSPVVERMLGWPAEQRLGTSVLDLVHPDDLERTREALAAAASEPAVARLPLLVRVSHRRGHWVPVEVVGVNLSENPAVGGIILNVRDVTDRERSDRLLAESQERYRRIVETADEGIWTIDAGGVTTFVNPRMAAMLGYTVAEMTGRSLYDFMDDESRSLAGQYVEHRKQGIAEHHEFEFSHRDGGPVWTRLSTSPVLGADGTYEGAIALVTDITEQREIQEQLRYNEARLSALFEASSDIMAVLELDGQWHASPAGTRILGYPMGYEPPGGLFSLLHPDDLEAAATALQEVLDGTRSTHEPIRLRVRHIDGHYRWFDCVGENRVDDPAVNGVVIIARDVTEQKAAEDARSEAEARFRSAFERSPLGIALFDLDGTFLDVNPAFCRIVGRSEAELVGRPAIDLVVPEHRTRILEEGIARAEERTDGMPEVVSMLHGDGHLVWVLVDVSMVRHADGSPAYVIGLVADVTERRKLEERLEFQAFHDPLTQLVNRARLRELMEEAWTRRSEPGRLALLFVDLDRFKQVNDTLGHEAGDEVLLLAARRLERAVRAGDTVARFGGDEFVVICDDVDGRDEAVQIAGRIRETLARTYRVSAGTAEVAASVGVALDTGHDSVDDLLRDADIAAYRAKELGRNRVEVFGRVVGL